jgi:prepilin-type N-terminal cleavage/methylation domain-containing protein
VNRKPIIALQRRQGFTLIEILVVIAIIAILASLLLAGVIAVMKTGPEVKTRNDILQLQQGINNFHTDKKFYPPDRIRLCSNHTQYGTSALDQESLKCISAMFPNLGVFTNVRWAGPGTSTTLDVTLEGDQAIVFYLLGPPNGASTPQLMGGFSTNPTDPIDVANAAPNRKRYIEYDLSRLKLMPRAGNNAGDKFPSYIDGYDKQPLVYFSSNARPNGYTPGVTNTLGVSPYQQQTSPLTYYHSSTFQIISAGADAKFGPGGLWTAGNFQAMSTAGKDDMSNFSERKLGVGP